MNIRELKDFLSYHVTRASKELVIKVIAAQFARGNGSYYFYGAGRELFKNAGWVCVFPNKKIHGIAYYVCPKKDWDTIFVRESKKQEALKQASRDIHIKNK